MSKVKIKKNRDDAIDQAEKLLLDCNPVVMPLTHRFTKGMYIREIFMPKGTLLTSEIHKTNHPFVVSKGHCQVYDGDDVIEIKAPYTGITEPNTRRLIYVEEDTIWTTFHVTKHKCLKKIEKQLIKKRKNKLVSQEKLKKITKKIRSINEFMDNKKLGGN